MKDWLKVFLALTAIIGGATCIVFFLVIAIRAPGWAESNLPAAVVGVVLLAAGATFFWMQSRSYKG